MASNFGSSQVFQGLGTVVVTIPVAGVYNVRGNSTLPMLSQGASGPSGLVAVIKQNTSTLYTGTAGASGFGYTPINCAAGDTISLVLSSSNAVDSAYNAVKTTFQVSSGE